MSIRTDLKTHLEAQTGITNLVSTRIFGIKRPQKNRTLPAITYERLSGGHDHTLSSAAGSAMPRFRIHCWATTYVGADTLAEAVRNEMQGFSGAMGSTTTHSVILEDESDEYEDPEDASDQGVYGIALDYLIRYVESLPTL